MSDVKTITKIKRTPARLPESETPEPTSEEKLIVTPDEHPLHELFGSIAPPQMHLSSPDLAQIQVTNFSPNQLQALSEVSLAPWIVTNKIEVDGRPFDFDSHRYLLPLYMDDSREIAVMKAAQMGYTIWMLLYVVFFLTKNVAKGCFYFPTQDGVSKLSRDRLAPMIRSNAKLASLVQETDTIGYKKIGEKSALYLQHMGGEATKDSTPFDMICFDEVRLLNPADIDQARERISHSNFKRVLQISTAGFPGCFSGETTLYLRNKKTKKIVYKQIGKLENSYYKYEILTYDDERKQSVWRNIIGWVNHGLRTVCKMFIENNPSFSNYHHLICTPDHPFATSYEEGLTFTPAAKSSHVLQYVFNEKKECEYLRKAPVAVTALQTKLVEVFDIQVEEFSWFFTGDGFLVHNSDIHRIFNLGTQNYWHVKCSAKCSDGFIPSECWPDCIAVTQKKEIYLRCPKCGMRIRDPQNGRYIPHNPGANFPSYHISQLISKYISPAEIWDAWQRTQNLKEFYNAKLGKPYVDEENQPIKDDDLGACENSDLLWGKTIPLHGGKYPTAMGVDQMSGVNYAVIAEQHSNKKRIIHYEIIDNKNPLYYEAGKRVTPFKRLYELMKEFDVDLCLIDAMPNINEAVELAQAFPRRVFVTHYIDGQKELVQWGDRPKYKMTVKKGGPRLKLKHTAMLNRYQSIDFVLSEIANRNYEWATPERLVQIARSLQSGLYEPLHIMKTHFYMHLKCMVRQKRVIDEATGRFVMEWISLNTDPHTTHSLNLCNIALERLRRTPFFTFA